MDIGVMVSYSSLMYYFTYVVGDIKYMTLYMTTFYVRRHFRNVDWAVRMAESSIKRRHL
jgi:uncharacterized protein YutD